MLSNSATINIIKARMLMVEIKGGKTAKKCKLMHGLVFGMVLIRNEESYEAI